MADARDEAEQHAREEILRLYTAIRFICARLPLPIVLPAVPETASNMDDAVRRVVEVIEDMTQVPPRTRTELDISCRHWMAALDTLAVINGGRWSDVRITTISMLLWQTEDTLHGVRNWLDSQELS